MFERHTFEPQLYMSRMYGDSPLKYNQTTQISLVQVLSVFAIVLMSFVIPAQVITYSKNRNAVETAYNLSNVAERTSTTTISLSPTSSAGQVAGINTRSNSIIQIPGTNSVINLNS